MEIREGSLVARILRKVIIEGHETMALFDTDSARSYALKAITKEAPRIIVKPYTVGIGGRTIIVKEECILKGEIEGLEFTIKAVPVDELGMVNGHTIGIIIGATAMEEWEVRIDVAKAELDLSGLRRREFIEY
ncbi:MAG: hypothetical protein QXP60_06455 [Nitrososphaerota archaeon]